MKKRTGISDTFGQLAGRAAFIAGGVWSFAAALAIIVIWLVTGPVFKFSDTWQLVINTSTTVITFLMVFLIQHSQNKDTRALQLKLNELIAAMEGASNRLIDIEDLSDKELEQLYHRYQHLARSAERLTPGAKTSVEGE